MKLALNVLMIGLSKSIRKLVFNILKNSLLPTGLFMLANLLLSSFNMSGKALVGNFCSG
jgi:hypothetical protein